MERYVVKKGLVKGYTIGLGNDNLYIPVPDRNVISFKKIEGQIEAMLVDGRRMIINDWNERITDEEFKDKFGRGKYRIGYFLFKEETEEDKLKRQCKEGLFG